MNYFLTGPKHIGKSTVRRQVLEELNCSFGGFQTALVRDEEGRPVSCHILPCFSDPSVPAGTAVPSPENRIFFCPGKQLLSPVLDANAEKILRLVLSEGHRPDLIVMDELGSAESDDLFFQALVRECLDSDIPVFGVLQACGSDFISSVLSREDTVLFEITEANRDAVVKAVCDRMKKGSAFRRNTL